MKKFLLAALCWLSLCVTTSAQLGPLNGVPGCGVGAPGDALDGIGVFNGCLTGIPPGASNSWVLPGASIDMDFSDGLYFGATPSGLTVSRASVGYANDSSGNWFSFAANTPRITSQGLLVEEARTNSIRNNSMAGAVVMADGVELTTNGNFAAQGTGWTVNTSGGGSVVFGTGSVTITGDGSTDNTNITQQITGLVIGRNYVVSFVATTGNTFQLAVGNTAGHGEVVGYTSVQSNGSASASPDRIAFTATATSHWISLGRIFGTPIAVTSISVQDGERVENGGFTTNPLNASQNTVQNGWQWTINTGTGTVVYNSGPQTVTLTGDGTHTALIDVAIPTVSGFTYTISVDAGSSAATGAVNAGTTVYGTQNLSSASVAIANGQKFQFTATATTTHVSFSKTGAAAFTFGNVSVQSAGALPTNWVGLAAGTNVLGYIVGIGTDQGVNYIDLQSVFSASGTHTIQFDTGSQVAATYGQTWTTSLFAAQSGGSSSGISSWQILLSEDTSGGSFIAATTQVITPPAGTGILGANKFSASRTLAASNVGATISALRVNSSGVANVTTRFGWPQLENNSLINSSVSAAAVNAAGSGYGTSVSGTMTWSGSGCSTNPVLNVTTNSSGNIASVSSVATAGSCTTFPSSSATTWTPGGSLTAGTLASFTLTPTNNAAQAFATSPIPTTSAAVTRAADVINLASPPVFGAAYSLFGKGTPQAPSPTSNAQSVIDISFGSSTTQRTLMRRNTAGTYLIGSVGGSNAQPNPSGTWVQSTSSKLAGAFAAGNQAGVANGGTVATTTGASLPTTPTQVNIGMNGATTEQFNGFISRIALWPSTALSNTTLQSITSGP